MGTVAKPEVRTGLRRVYCQGPELLSLLSRDDSLFDAQPLPATFSADDLTPRVILAETPAIFTPELETGRRCYPSRSPYDCASYVVSRLRREA